MTGDWRLENGDSGKQSRCNYDMVGHGFVNGEMQYRHNTKNKTNTWDKSYTYFISTRDIPVVR